MVWGQMAIKKKWSVDNMFPAPAMCRLGDCPRVAFLCVCVYPVCSWWWGGRWWITISQEPSCVDRLPSRTLLSCLCGSWWTVAGTLRAAAAAAPR